MPPYTAFVGRYCGRQVAAPTDSIAVGLGNVGEGLCALPYSKQSLRHGYRRATSLYKGGLILSYIGVVL